MLFGEKCKIAKSKREKRELAFTPHSSELLDGALVDLTRFRRHISASSTKLLECQRAQQVKMTVPADSIVETLDVIEHV